MFGSAIFEAAIGTVVIYILLSLVCLVLNEWVSRLLALRSGILEKALRKLVGPGLADELNRHPLIHGLVDSGRYPSYIPTSTFALALMEIGYDYIPGVNGAPGTTRVKAVWTGKSFELLEALRLAATSMGPIQARVEKWFDLAMEHTSGQFKRIAQLWILAISAVIVGVANVDTISIASHLYDGAINKAPTHFPLFWHAGDPIGPSLPGLALTWAAVSLGAPFWFDVLNKLVNIRQTGLPPDENKRQTGGPAMLPH